MKPSAEWQLLGRAILDDLLPMQLALLEAVNQALPESKGIIDSSLFIVCQLQSHAVAVLPDQSPLQAPRKTMLRHLEQTPLPLVMMLFLTDMIVADQRKQKRIASVHLTRIAVDDR